MQKHELGALSLLPLAGRWQRPVLRVQFKQLSCDSAMLCRQGRSTGSHPACEHGLQHHSEARYCTP